MALNDKKFNQDLFTRIFDVWARKTPSYEKHYEQEVIKVISDFGKGTNEASDAKGKILGAGYEPLIMAFFIGLYSNKKIPFDQYADIKDLGQPIQFWGNLDSKKGRRAYPRLKEYIFVALVARTPEIDWIALDKGKWTVNETVALLMSTMEEYINYGLAIIIFTIIVKLILLPLNVKSQKAMKKQQKIQPILAELQEKYKND
ncbi:MAG: YidC/Oxa1 family membrane protein insertase, partial [Prevotella sp.]|nr:YidC/Oxa1 family membrane protein insertase [Prevotella sp.]